MPLTAAEKMRGRRQKLKDEGRYEEYKVKQKERMQKAREKNKKELEKLSKKKKEAILKEERNKVRERVARWRQSQKEKLLAASPIAFKNPSSLGKATARVKKVLPKSPRKKRSVVKKLFEVIIGTENQKQEKSEEKSNSLALTLNTIKSVKDFYEREDRSRLSPGMKDVVTVKDAQGVKRKVQTRHLCQSVLETHALFCSETGIKIGKSKFAELRPIHVKPSSKLPHNVCLCKYHENFTEAIKAFHAAIPSFPKYNENFCKDFLCTPSTENCWLFKCDGCKDNLFNEMQKQIDENGVSQEVSWIVWKEVDGNLHKVLQEDTIEELMSYIHTSSSQFFEHVHIKREQTSSYNHQREKMASKEFDPALALLQVDFAENYSCFAQNEIQSYHWCQPQVSLFTCSLWYGGKQRPYVIVSDNLTHSKDTILAYMSRILGELPQEVKEVRIWSDGPSSQFKNKFIASSFKVLQKQCGKQIIWNYFATSHGKGPVDGIGAAVKRQVRQEVLKNKAIVSNAEHFYDVAKQTSNVAIILMTSEDILKKNHDLNLETVFEKAAVVKGISKVHVMYFNEKSGLVTHSMTKNMVSDVNESDKVCEQVQRRSVYYDIYSSSESDESQDEERLQDEVIQKKPSETDIKHGTFALVQFEEENTGKVYKYAAICQTKVDSLKDVKVMCLKTMGKSRQAFQVNDCEEEPFVNFNNIVEILPEPNIKFNGERMYYLFHKDINVCQK